ncbi:LCP family protein [Candidatus Bipolaricaulota bacterium]|nr:LCP family protein [Candidatus Bipolaricaulota bacterium]
MSGTTVRKQVFIYAGIALALAAAVVVWFVLSQQDANTLFIERERVNVLLVGRGSAAAVNLMSLVSISETDVVLFSLPTNLRLRDASGAFQSAAEVCEAAGLAAGAEAIATLIGLDIPFHMAYSDGILKSWIDSLGGLTISLNATAVYMDGTVEPPLRVEIRPGEQLFSGSEATAFAALPSEPDDMGLLKRQQSFLRALLGQGIAASPVRSMRSMVRDAAAALETNLSLSELQQVALALHDVPQDAVRSNQLVGEIVEIDGVSYTQPNVVGTERLVAALLKGLELLTPSDVNVAVFNGNGVRLMASRTADYLSARGFQVTGIGNADAFDYETSYVIVLSDESKAWVLRDALPSGVQIVFPETFASRYEALSDFIPAGTDIVLIAGAGLEIE